MSVSIARIYGYGRAEGSRTVLVDRLWPRGVSREEVPFDSWMKQVAPSTELRKWYAHVQDRFSEFADLYGRELTEDPARQGLEELREMSRKADLVLLTATKDIEHSAAAVLLKLLTATGHQ